MEPLRASALLHDLSERLTESLALLHSPSAATEKERRQNPTSLFPLPANCDLPFPPIHDQEATDDPFDVDDMWEKILYPITSLADKSEAFTLWVTPSSKSRAHGMQPHNDLLRFEVMRLSKTSGVELPTLTSLMWNLGYEVELGMITSGSMGTNAYFRDVWLALQEKDFDSPVLTMFDERWKRPLDATLSVKVYSERGEIRAYTQDHNPVRSLLGSIIHAVIHPKDKALRYAYPWAPAWRVKYKHIISEKMERSPTLCHFMCGQGDVSSFTSSFRNVWLVLLRMCRASEMLESEDRLPPIVATWDGVAIQLTLSEAMKMFFYLAFRMRVWDNVLQEEFISVGGMLGVSGINTLGVSTFAIMSLCMDEYFLTQDEPLRSVVTYVGGDDFFTKHLNFRETDIFFSWSRRCGAIEKYIGTLSENNLYSVPTRITPTGSQLLPLRFCKKLLFVNWVTYGHGRTIQLQSQFRIAMPSILLANSGVFNLRQEEQWLAYSSCLWDQLPWIAEREILLSTMFDIADRVLKEPAPRLRRTTVLPTFEGFVNRDNESDKCEQAIDTFIPSNARGRNWPPNREEVRRLLVWRKVITIRDVSASHYSRTLYLTKVDLHYLRSTEPQFTTISTTVDPLLYWSLEISLKILVLRNALKGYRL